MALASWKKRKIEQELRENYKNQRIAEMSQPVKAIKEQFNKWAISVFLTVSSPVDRVGGLHVSRELCVDEITEIQKRFNCKVLTEPPINICIPKNSGTVIYVGW